MIYCKNCDGKGTLCCEGKYCSECDGRGWFPKIIASAIKYNEIIYTGRRHHNIISDMRNKYLILDKQAIRYQGFILENGNYIDRIQAAKIALGSGQIKKLNHPPNLYSEDLW